MNKKITFITIMFFVVSVFLYPGKKEQQDLYLKAVAEKDNSARMTLLKEYITQYGDTDDKYLRFIYLNIADTAYKLKNYDEAIQYGELSLKQEDINPQNKLKIYFSLANSYMITKRDLDKALEYAGQIIEAAKQMIEMSKNQAQDPEQSKQYIANYEKYYIAPGNQLQGLIYYDKGETKLAVKKFLESYKYDKNESTYNRIFYLAINLYKKGKTDEAIETVLKIVDTDNLKYKEANFLASAYYKKKDKENTVKYYEIAYKTKPRADLAMKIARLTNKTEPSKALKYFADAFVLKESDKMSDAYKYMEQLYFNVIAKGKAPAEQEKGFKEVISAAKARLSMGPADSNEELPAPANTQDQE
jgi:tetratricopeptide (TPR) repeat protein